VKTERKRTLGKPSHHFVNNGNMNLKEVGRDMYLDKNDLG
jgi:hypothetical protein